ncbi:MAG: hypothetical protein IJW68_00110 [Bacteroidaceae bacterium]|nr:hypothetical protein [Bacteroidaceae bacterium]
MSQVYLSEDFYFFSARKLAAARGCAKANPTLSAEKGKYKPTVLVIFFYWGFKSHSFRRKRQVQTHGTCHFFLGGLNPTLSAEKSKKLSQVYLSEDFYFFSARKLAAARGCAKANPTLSAIKMLHSWS